MNAATAIAPPAPAANVAFESEFQKGTADIEARLNDQRVAPPVFLYLNAGRNLWLSDRGIREFDLHVDKVMLALMLHSKREIEAGGGSLYFDNEHRDQGRVARVLDFRWAPDDSGIEVLVAWSPEAEAIICATATQSLYLSPQFVYTSSFLGLKPNCGGLTKTPRLRASRPIKPITAQSALLEKAHWFSSLVVQGIDAAGHARAGDVRVALAARFPDLAAASELLEALNRKKAERELVRTAALQRAERERQVTEFIQLVDFRANGGGKLHPERTAAAFDAIALERPDLHRAWQTSRNGGAA